MALVKQCGTSWIELRLPSKEPEAQIDVPLATMAMTTEEVKLQEDKVAESDIPLSMITTTTCESNERIKLKDD